MTCIIFYIWIRQNEEKNKRFRKKRDCICIRPNIFKLILNDQNILWKMWKLNKILRHILIIIIGNLQEKQEELLIYPLELCIFSINS